MVKKSKKILESELKQSRAEGGDEWYILLYGNFDSYLPGGHREYRTDNKETYFFRLWDSKFREQSSSDFFTTLDKIMSELNISSEELVRLRKQYGDSYYENKRDVSFFDRILPIYARLREMGYSRRDLCV